MKKNWKTTLAGILAVTPFLLSLFGIHLPPDVAGAITTIATGGGLLAAKDSNVTGGTKQQ